MKLLTLLICLFISFSLYSQSKGSAKAESIGKSKYKIWINLRSSTENDELKKLQLASTDLLFNETINLQGLHQLKDSSILVSSLIGQNFYEIPVSNIDIINYQKKGGTVKGILIGTAIGLATGILTGLAYPEADNNSYNSTASPRTRSIDPYNPPVRMGSAFGSLDLSFSLDRSTATALYGTFFAITGGIIGGKIGSAVSKGRILIFGGKHPYAREKKKLKKLLMTNK